MTEVKCLDLTNSVVSQINYTISKFPDGQQSITINAGIDVGNRVIISSRLNSFRDLELIITANQCLIEMGVKRISLYVPYFLGARSDRKFSIGGVNYLKSVICPIINSQNFTKVSVLDPHSDVLEACLNNYDTINNYLLDHAIEDLTKTIKKDDIVLISPDAGAFKKIFDVAKRFEFDKIITASKVRDLKTGNILYTDVPGIEIHKNVKYVIIDDICDGGRTFTEIAKTIHNVRPTADVYLVVTHGIFSAGFEQLKVQLSGIYTTNSVYDIAEEHSDFVKQYKVI